MLQPASLGQTPSSSDARLRQLLLNAEDTLVSALAHVASSRELSALIRDYVAGLREAREKLDHEGIADAWAPRTKRQRDYAALVALGLTRRQLEVVAMIRQGLRNAEIARRLVLEQGTVANHVARILERLGLRNRTQIAMWATEHGVGEEQAPPVATSEPAYQRAG